MIALIALDPVELRLVGLIHPFRGACVQTDILISNKIMPRHEGVSRLDLDARIDGKFRVVTKIVTISRHAKAYTGLPLELDAILRRIAVLPI